MAERNSSSLVRRRSLNSLGAIAFLARNWRLKFDRFSNPESKQISATVLSVLRNIWQAWLMRRSPTALIKVRPVAAWQNRRNAQARIPQTWPDTARGYTI